MATCGDAKSGYTKEIWSVVFFRLLSTRAPDDETEDRIGLAYQMNAPNVGPWDAEVEQVSSVMIRPSTGTLFVYSDWLRRGGEADHGRRIWILKNYTAHISADPMPAASGAVVHCDGCYSILQTDNPIILAPQSRLITSVLGKGWL